MIMKAPFLLGSVEEVRDLLTEAGFYEVQAQTSLGAVRFTSISDFVQYQVTGSPLAGPVMQAGDKARSALLSTLSTALQPYVEDAGLVFPIEGHILTAQR